MGAKSGTGGAEEVRTGERPPLYGFYHPHDGVRGVAPSCAAHCASGDRAAPVDMAEAVDDAGIGITRRLSTARHHLFVAVDASATV
jgi:hypothetical protein